MCVICVANRLGSESITCRNSARRNSLAADQRREIDTLWMDGVTHLQEASADERLRRPLSLRKRKPHQNRRRRNKIQRVLSQRRETAYHGKKSTAKNRKPGTNTCRPRRAQRASNRQTRINKKWGFAPVGNPKGIDLHMRMGKSSFQPAWPGCDLLTMRHGSQVLSRCMGLKTDSSPGQDVAKNCSKSSRLGDFLFFFFRMGFQFFLDFFVFFQFFFIVFAKICRFWSSLEELSK